VLDYDNLDGTLGFPNQALDGDIRISEPPGIGVSIETSENFQGHAVLRMLPRIPDALVAKVGNARQ
jgi:hypothetical protein